MTDYDVNNNIEYEDVDKTRANRESAGYKENVLNQLRTCTKEASKELTDSGIQRRIIDGQVVEVMMPNQKEIIIRSIKILYNLLIPEFEVDDKDRKPLQDEIGELNIKESKLKKNKTNKLQKLYNSQEETGKRGQPLITQDYVNRYEHWIKSQYEDQLLEIYEDKLVVICRLLKVMNYFEEQGTTMW